MKKFFVVLFLIISFSLFADIPSTGYDSQSWTNPGSALTDFTGMIDLSLMSSDWWLEADDVSGTKGRATKSDGTTELATDWIDYDDTAETGWLRVIWSGTLASSGTQIIRIYPPDTGNTAYSAADTYGSDNAYDSDWVSYWPLMSDFNDRTVNGYDGTGQGGISAGDSATGPFGKATTFDGSGDYLTLPSGVSSSLNGASGCTFIVWHDRDGTGTRDVFLDLTISGTKSKIFMEYQINNTIRAGGRSVASDIFQSNITTSTFTDTASYHSFVGILDLPNDNVIMDYDDVVQGDTGTIAWANTTFDSDVGTLQTIGMGADGSSNPFIGKMAGLQFHSVIRSVDWRSEEYAQTNDNATFWGTWAWSGGAPTGIAILRRRIMGYSIVFDFTFLMVLLNTISGMLLTYTVMKLKQAQKQLEWYSKPENIKALAIVELYLEENHE